MPLHLHSYRLTLPFLLIVLSLVSGIMVTIRYASSYGLAIGLPTLSQGKTQPRPNESQYQEHGSTVSFDWHAPQNWQVNDLDQVVNGSGIYGWTFDSSHNDPASTKYNWCNMPHLAPHNYPHPPKGYKLEYVEVLHRHHKRTPYASNTFPEEAYVWDCNDEGLFFSGQPLQPLSEASANTYWDVYTSDANPLRPDGFNGSCQFPQQTRGGLEDSHRHGADLKAVYGDMLRFIPSQYDPDVLSYRVTNNVITSQVASMLVSGMYPSLASKDVPLLIQPASIDSLEPAYPCPASDDLFSSYGVGSSSSAWLKHLQASQSLYKRLDALSGVSPTDPGWHKSWDHYFDNLSARLCHNKPLPCQIGNASNCVDTSTAEDVFRLGEYEYSFIYRDSSQSLAASVASFGIWIGELAQNIRHAMGQDLPASDGNDVRYRHNVAHDGSVARLLSILQADRMVWPGMGAEIVFELYSKHDKYFLRVLWTAEILKSSHPELGNMDMVPVEIVLSYFDGMVGKKSSRVLSLCSES
ncbi:phosphoglycerate mutase-like protein [Polychaeton citri CBS 116435]|uniref:Phosphoglycerate mutase-like protein n=1 Tax=Polychaeton citri CBS 116435 TaxID=1314669 RepID=A0A9P4QA07_9PEZI|nr:phosphoglycerate mutase-like protein [Polychaeton citri CBS 116435]